MHGFCCVWWHACCCCYLTVLDNYSSVMERSIWLEDILNKGGGNIALYGGAGIDYIPKACSHFHNYKSAYPALGKAGYGLMHFVHYLLAIS